jgi:hypothetical protein
LQQDVSQKKLSAEIIYGEFRNVGIMPMIAAFACREEDAKRR